MSEGEHNATAALQRAESVIQKNHRKIDNSLARFNLNLDGQNPPVTFDENIFSSVVDALAEPPLSERAIEELKTPRAFVDPETGQSLNGLQVNWDKWGESKRALLFSPPFNNRIETGATHYRIQELARYVNEPMLTFDHPSMGNSDELTDAQAASLDEGRYSEIARTQLRIMQEMGIKELDCVGQSMGGWALAEVAQHAPEYGIQVKNLLLIGVPSHKRPVVGLAMSFADAGKNLDLYQAAERDPDMIESSGQLKSKDEKNKDFKDFLKSSIKKGPRSYASAMAKGKLSDMLEEGISANPEMHVTIADGTIDKVSKTGENQKMIAGLVDNGLGNNVREIHFAGEPHVVMESAKRFGWFAKTMLTSG